MVPRYGPSILGGAETHVRALATHGAPADWSVEVATTCATDHVTWRNAVPEGTVTMDGVPVHRFEVGPRDAARYDRLHADILGGTAGYVDELEWLAHSVTSPGLDRFLEARASEYDLMVFSPYLFGTTVWGAQVAPERSALMPCLHDEPYARLRTVRGMLTAVRGCMFNAPGEERLAHSLATIRDGGVVGMGFDDPGALPGGTAPVPDGDYVVYAGRLEEGKGVHELVEMVTAMRELDPDAPRLVLLGSGGYTVPKRSRPHVVTPGFVPEAQKRAVMAGALALVSASRMESLSIVQLEAWLQRTPSIVSTGSVVMSDHCRRSGGGFAYAGPMEFREAVRQLRDDPGLHAAMGVRGREYVLDEYGWPAVRARFRALVERLAP